MADAPSYRLIARLAAGATGEVYRGEFVSATGIHRPVAIKLLRTDTERPDDLAARLRDEARMVARVRHPSIVRVEDLCTIDGRLAVVMELVDGADLGAIRDRCEPLSPRMSAELVFAVAGALLAAHEAPGPDGRPMHIVHRDIKPENIAIDVFGDVKVLDFGAARARFAGREAATTDHVPGTLPYMSPDRLIDEGEGLYGTPASDIWALAATATELAVGEPWMRIRKRGRRGSAQAAALVALSEAGTPEPLCALLAAMLADHPDDRPSLAEIVAASGELLQTLPGPGLRTAAAGLIRQARRVEEPLSSAPARADTVGVPAPEPPPRSEPPAEPHAAEPPPPTARLWGVAAGLLALAALVVGVRLAWSPQAAPSAAPVPPLVEPVPPVVPPDPPGGDDAPGGADPTGTEDPNLGTGGPSGPPTGPDTPPGTSAPPVGGGKDPTVTQPVPSAQDEDPSRRKTTSPPTPVKPPVPTYFVGLDLQDASVAAVTLNPGGHRLPATVPAGTYTPTTSFPAGEAATGKEVAINAPTVFRCFQTSCRARPAN